MKDRKVSIIVPVYNSEKFLDKCLNSLMAQTLKEIEIICVNDGSTDNSLKILQNYAQKDERVKIISQENKGLSAARNTALKTAIGKYIGFLDSDDFFASDFLEKLYFSAEKENADVAVSNIIRINKEKKENMLIYDKEKIAEKTDDIFKLLTIPKNCYVCNRIYRRDFILNNCLYFKEGVVFEDIIWSTVMASKAKKAVSVIGANYYYVYNENSIVATTEKDPKKQTDLHDAFLFYNKYIGENKIKAPIRWQTVTKVRILGLNLFKIEDLPLVKRKYYFLGLNIATVKFRKNY